MELESRNNEVIVEPGAEHTQQELNRLHGECSKMLQELVALEVGLHSFLSFSQYVFKCSITFLNSLFFREMEMKGRDTMKCA